MGRGGKDYLEIHVSYYKDFTRGEENCFLKISRVLHTQLCKIRHVHYIKITISFLRLAYSHHSPSLDSIYIYRIFSLNAT